MNAMKNILKKVILPGLMLALIVPVFSQESDTTQAEEKPKKDNRPVKDPFESGYLINNQTTLVPTAKTLEMVIQHRFGKISSGEFDMAGLYAPSNIRIGFNYAITDRFLVGIGSTKNYKLQDIQYKAAILKQTRSGNIPVSVTYFGNTAFDARKDTTITTTNRLSYFHQLIISRKFGKWASIQVAPSFSHFNIVDTLVKHDNIALSFSGRVRATDAIGIVFEYDMPLTKQDTSVIKVKPNLGIGIEASTSAHVFQVFFGTYENIINQHNVLYNRNDFAKDKLKGMLIGFNITRLWNF